MWQPLLNSKEAISKSIDVNQKVYKRQKVKDYDNYKIREIIKYIFPDHQQIKI